MSDYPFAYPAQALPPVRKTSLSPTKRYGFMVAASAALFTVMAQPVAFQDAAARLLAQGNDSGRWAQSFLAAPEGSVHSAIFDLKNVDDTLTGSVTGKEGASVGLADEGGVIAVRGVDGASPVGKQRANEAIKGDRVIKRLHDQIAPTFKAGSIVKAAHILSEPDRKSVELVASFVPDAKPGAVPQGEEIMVATNFHPKRKAPLPGTVDLPVMVASLVTGPGDGYALGYVPPKPNWFEDSPFDAVLKTPDKPKRFIAPAGPRDHGWVKTPLPISSFSKEQQRCLARGIYFEARGEPVKGQAAVAQVILNRVRNPTFPSSICGVVYQNKTWRNRCQFSFACDRIRDRVTNMKLYNQIQQVAAATTSGKIWLEEIGSSTHYHATYVRPRWARSMYKLSRIGKHIFYRTRNGGWS